MLPPDLYLAFIKPLHDAGISYMVTGSVASMIYGEPRLTLDVDLVLALKAGEAAKLKVIFPEDKYYVPPEDVILAENNRDIRGHWNIIDHNTGLKADFYPVGCDPLPLFFWPRKCLKSVSQGSFWLAPPEYVILRKLQYFAEGGSDKHLRDIDRMLQLSEDMIDLTLLQEKICELRLQEAWLKLQK